MKKIQTWISALTFLLLALPACGTIKIMVPVTRPAEINLKGFNKIAIGKITGKFSIDFRDELTQALFESGRFEVMERQNLTRIIQEHKLSRSGMIDESTAVEIGKLTGVDALIFGRVPVYDYKEDLSYRDKKDKEGKSYRSYTRKGTATVRAVIKVVDLKSGKILAMNKIEKNYHDAKASTDKRPAHIDQSHLLTLSRQAVVREFMKKIAPYREYVQVTLLNDKKMPELEKGIFLIKDLGNWDKAKEYFKKATEKYSNNPKIPIDKAWYNLGVAHEYTNSFEKAEKCLMKAYEIKPEKQYAVELQTAKRMVKERKKLEEQQR